LDASSKAVGFAAQFLKPRVTRRTSVLVVTIFLATFPIVARDIESSQTTQGTTPSLLEALSVEKEESDARTHFLTRAIGTERLNKPSISSQSLGGGVLSLAFSDSFPVEDRSYAQAVFALVYPELVAIYGAPAQTSEVVLEYLPGISGVGGCPPTVQIGFLPQGGDNSHAWDATFIHELLHTFHCGVSIPYPWAEEGMTTLAQYLVMQRLVESGKMDSFAGNEYYQLASALLQYDAKQYLDPDAFYYWWAYTQARPAHYSGAAFFSILSTYANGFLLKLNEALYVEANSRADYSDSWVFDRERFVLVLKNVLGDVSVDGLPLEEWIERQSITYVGESVTGRSNTRIVAFPLDPENFKSIFVAAVDAKTYGYVKNLHVELQVIDVLGNVVFETGQNSGENGVSLVDVPPLPEGGYKVQVSTEYEGQSLIGVTYGIRQSVYDLTWTKHGCDCVFGMVMDSYGNPVQLPITTNATLRANTNGAFVIDTSSPQVAITIKSETRVVTRPGPYSRVVWLPAQTPDDFSILISPARAKVTSYGAVASYGITISSIGGFQGIVWVTAAGYPSSFGTATLEPSFARIGPSNGGVMSLTFMGGYGDAAPYQGSYRVRLVAKSGPLIHISVVVLDVTWLLYAEFKGNSLLLEVLTNSSTSRDDFQYDPKSQSMSFTAGGPEGTQGFMNATFDVQLISGLPVVLVDGNIAAYAWSRVNATDYFIHVSYGHSTRVIAIRGSEPVPTDLKIEVSPGTINMTRGENATIEGLLLTNGYYPLEGRPVEIECSLNNVDWNFVAWVPTSADGRFSYSWLPPSLGNFMLRARWDGDGTYSSAMSPNATAQVVPEFFHPVFIAIIALALVGLIRRPLRSSNASQTTRGPCLPRSANHCASFCLTQYAPPVPSLCA
jgi:hypothetical protein